MIVQSPWERLIAPESAFRLQPLRDTEVAHFYWCTDIKTTEIWEAFDAPNASSLVDLAGPALFAGMPCDRCSGNIFAFSRNDALRRTGDIKNVHARRRIVCGSPFICRQCKEAVYQEQYGERDAQVRREWEAIEQRERELRFMPYQEYLRTPEWQNTRQGALKRAGFKCQTCSSDVELHVHHRTYIRRGCERNADLVVLCADCHQIFHDNGKLAENGRAA